PQAVADLVPDRMGQLSFRRVEESRVQLDRASPDLAVRSDLRDLLLAPAQRHRNTPQSTPQTGRSVSTRLLQVEVVGYPGTVKEEVVDHEEDSAAGFTPDRALWGVEGPTPSARQGGLPGQELIEHEQVKRGVVRVDED